MSPIVRRKKERFHLQPKYSLLILTVLCVFIMSVTITTEMEHTYINKVLGAVFVPFQKGLTDIGSFCINRVEELQQIRVLLDRNEELEAKVDDLNLKLVQYQQERYELTALRELYELDDDYSEYKKIGARIIGGGSSNWNNYFIIDKGSDQGLLMNMNVLAGEGLVGRIDEVGPNWSKVVSIVDDSSNVSGKILSTGDNLIVSGNLLLLDSGYIEFSQLKDTDNLVVVGDKVVTSNISDKYLPGILIGYINNIQTDSNHLTKSGYLTPAVDFEHIEEVLVITTLKQADFNTD